MARYTGPKQKISRRFGQPIFGPSKVLERRNFPPGQHGGRNTRRKRSDYGVALGEKQKLKFIYGVLERQFRNYFSTAASQRGVTGLTLLQILESRLDNICYRLGFANTRRSARQLVSHGHITVNGHIVNVSNFQAKPGDIVSVKENPHTQQLVQRNMEMTQGTPVPDWLTVDRNKISGTVNRLPQRDEIDANVNEQSVVELYSR
jgi:small subunit ribosomal protein S4